MKRLKEASGHKVITGVKVFRDDIEKILDLLS